MTTLVDVYLNVRRYDISETPDTELAHLRLDKDLDYPTLKKEVQTRFDIYENGKKVIKIRNKHHVLVPMSDLLKGSDALNPFIVEISKVHHTIPLAKNNANLLQDAYLDAIRQKIRTMETRVSQAELLIPQLQWRRQAYMDETVNTLSSKVGFLNRRIDELMPPEWKCKMPETIS